jgi:GTP-binding protein
VAGLTRDRHYGQAQHNDLRFILVDTGGLEADPEIGNIYRVMAKQTLQAVVESDVVILVVDAQEGLNAQDAHIASELRRLGKRWVLAVNKAEGLSLTHATVSTFFELGCAHIWPVSAAHGQGLRALLDNVLEPFLTLPQTSQDTPAQDKASSEETDPTDSPIRLAVVGRPNVGKSTLINTWLGEERLVAFDQPGTTRDAIHIPFSYQDQAFTLIDTAGLRRKGRVFEAVEKFSVIKTLQAIEQAHVALLVLDATQGVSDQDAHIARYVLDSGRAVVVAVNKWDAVDNYQRTQTRQALDLQLTFLSFAQTCLISAQKRQGLKPLWQALIQAYQAAHRKMSTPLLTRALQTALDQQSPPRCGLFRPKPRYAHQGGSNPPRIIIHGNNLDHIPPSYKRYLEGRFRQSFALQGTPLFIEFKTTHNPYVEVKHHGHTSRK